MDSAQLLRLAIAGGILFAVYRFGNAELKTGAIAVSAYIVAKQIPYVNEVI
jgi:hypothetical protein